jgi:SAM-dependent methyltransferase
MIDPQEMMQRLSAEQLRVTADRYFASLEDPTSWMIKPFSSLSEAPELLQNIGVLLSGMYLGKTMTVLDFGAGSCWLSRMLTQLQCQTISCDVSDKALEIGKQLYTKLPVLGRSFPPKFLPFNGRDIDLSDNAVDRIVCNDAFHHVSNPGEVLREFARVLKSGGIAGFSEPGRFHSRSPQSQQEMRNYAVLENDVDLDAISNLARSAGFDRLSCKWMANMDATLEEHHALLAGNETQKNVSLEREIEQRLISNTRHVMKDKTIFYLYKGPVHLDSRGHVGLAHDISFERSDYTILRGQTLFLEFNVRNTGTAEWLTENVLGIGVVKAAAHLYDQNLQLLSLDFCRQHFTSNTLPGVNVRMIMPMQFDTSGSFVVAVDMVSEGVCWFETLGSIPKYIKVHVT